MQVHCISYLGLRYLDIYPWQPPPYHAHRKYQWLICKLETLFDNLNTHQYENPYVFLNASCTLLMQFTVGTSDSWQIKTHKTVQGSRAIKILSASNQNFFSRRNSNPNPISQSINYFYTYLNRSVRCGGDLWQLLPRTKCGYFFCWKVSTVPKNNETSECQKWKFRSEVIVISPK